MFQSRKLQTLQASRGAAALLVFAFHLTYIGKDTFGVDVAKGVFRFGACGVDFFFVLSGFIIFFIHHDDIAKSGRLWPYVTKRLARVYPLYWVIALVLLPIYFSPLTTALSPTQYFVTLFKSFLLLPQPSNPMVTVAWTLSFEVFFYSMFALAIYLSKPVSRIVVVFWLTFSLITYLDKMGLAGPLTFVSPARVRVLEFVFSFYNLEFAMGCFVAFAATRFQIQHPGKLALGAAAIFIIAGMLESFSSQKFLRVSGVAHYGVPAALFIFGAVSWEIRKAVALPAALLFLGDASYSIYLTHLPVLDLLSKLALALKDRNSLGPSFTVVIILFVTIGAGLLCYHFVERPLLALFHGRMFVNRRATINPQVQ